MESAGRILLMPKGEYSASETYAMLDMVNHSGASWVCKKDCTGQTPSDSNTEFWQRFGTAVDLSNYFKNTGGTVNGNVIVQTNGDTYRDFILKGASKTVLLRMFDDGTFHFHDQTNNKNIFMNYKDGTNTFNGTASGNLPNTGGKLTGDLSIAKHNNGSTKFIKNHSASADYGTRIYDISADGKQAGFGWSAGSKTPWFVDNTGKESELLHTGNKPAGSYTGNGDATARQINVGGVGETLRIANSVLGIAFVTKQGAHCITEDGTLILPPSECKFENGTLTMATKASIVNSNGYNFYYDLL